MQTYGTLSIYYWVMLPKKGEDRIQRRVLHREKDIFCEDAERMVVKMREMNPSMELVGEWVPYVTPVSW